MTLQNISVLGATGSIGDSTLKVIAQHPDKYRVFALSGYSQIDKLARLCQQFVPEFVVVPAEKHALLTEKLHNLPTQILCGETGLIEVASHDEVDVVMAAIVGAVGLASTLAAVKADKHVLLANKESLVMAGDIVMRAVKNSHAQLLPVDSEHNAIFQSLPQQVLATGGGLGQDIDFLAHGVSHVSLTASGGPFLHWSLDEMAGATVADACKHPNWSMGRKISVDSATMMNKGLELIEACVLFGLAESAIQVVVHPESVIHSAVHYTDGSVIAQLGLPDMCTPIAHALAWPSRVETQVAPLDFVRLSQLTFHAPDDNKFPCLALARHAAKVGGAAPLVLNAANEVAVAAFLQQRISFLQIHALTDALLSSATLDACQDIDSVCALDTETRRHAHAWLVTHA